MDIHFQTLRVEYVTTALRAGCGIKYDWADLRLDELTKIAEAAAAGRASLVFLVSAGANIPIETLEMLGRAGQGYVSMDFSYGS